MMAGSGVWNHFRILIAFGAAQLTNKSQGTNVLSLCHFWSSDLEYKNVVEVLCWLLALCGITSESLLLLASVSGKSDSVAALNVTVVGYSSWIL